MQIEIKQKWKTIIDQVEIVSMMHVVKKTLFLSPGEWNYSDSVLSHNTNIQWVLEGGHKNAERKRLVMYPDYMNYEDIEKITALLKISHKASTSDLTHRDYLGALLSLGIEREIIGDIIVVEDGAYMFTIPEMKDYVRFNLATVGSIKVLVEDADTLPNEVEIDDMIIIKGTVAALRIDSVIAMSFRLSRQKAQSMVAAQKVKVNWLTVSKSTVLLQEHDMVSVYGYGRFKMLGIGKQSRSKRWHIEVGKMK